GQPLWSLRTIRGVVSLRSSDCRNSRTRGQAASTVLHPAQPTLLTPRWMRVSGNRGCSGKRSAGCRVCSNSGKTQDPLYHRGMEVGALYAGPARARARGQGPLKFKIDALNEDQMQVAGHYLVYHVIVDQHDEDWRDRSLGT